MLGAIVIMKSNTKKESPNKMTEETETANAQSDLSKEKADEHGGPKGLEPTRYGDWEKNGRCIDF